MHLIKVPGEELAALSTGACTGQFWFTIPPVSLERGSHLGSLAHVHAKRMKDPDPGPLLKDPKCLAKVYYVKSLEPLINTVSQVLERACTPPSIITL